MSVLLVTDDVDDDISIDCKDNFYKQLKDLDYDYSLITTSSSPSILVQSNQHYRQHRRRRRRCCRSQQWLLQHLLTYMYTLLILTNHLHWSVIIFSVSSMKIMSTHATTTISKRPLLTPSIKSTTTANHLNEQQCLTLTNSLIDRICSKTCRIGQVPFVSATDSYNPFVGEQFFLPFCSNLLNQTIIHEQFFNQTNERQCRRILNRILESDGNARKATELFATYMQAIDSASEQNRYSIITADCQVKRIELERFELTFVFRVLIEYGLVRFKFHFTIEINSYRLVNRSVMKLNVFVRHFDRVIVNHCSPDNPYSSVTVMKTHIRKSDFFCLSH